MLNCDFDFTGRFVKAKYVKGNNNSNNFTANGKYFITIAHDYKSNQTNQYKTMFHEFTLWNDDQNKRMAKFARYVDVGDTVEVAGRFTLDRKASNGTWYNSEDNITGYHRISRSFKNQERVNARKKQSNGSQLNAQRANLQNQVPRNRTMNQSGSFSVHQNPFKNVPKNGQRLNPHDPNLPF